MYQAPRGTHDVLPDDAHAWRYVEDTARRLASLAGYHEIRTPTFEETSVFLRGVGESTDIVEKEMYTFLDKGGDSMTLRPEATAGIVRAYLQHGLSSRPQPVKLFTLIQAFRYDRPSKGRFRQFHQLDLEAIGETDALIDAELVAWQWRFYAKLGLGRLSLQVNSIGDAECRPTYIAALRDYFERNAAGLCADCRRRLETNPLRLLDDKTPACQPILDGAPKSIDYLCGPCLDHFRQWLDYMTAAGLQFEINARLVRGLDYYTRSVWEIWPPVVGAQSTIGGGGRYDGLAEQLGGRPTPGVGFATGIERILLELRDQQVTLPPEPTPDAFVVYQHADAKSTAFRLVEGLRAADVRTDLAFGDRRLGKQLAAADRAGARVVLILGEDELARGEVTLKDLRDGRDQQAVAQSDVVPVVRRWLEQTGMTRLQELAIERLDGAVRRYEEIGQELSQPSTFEDTRHAAELGREQAELSDLVDRYATYRSLTTQLDQAEELVRDGADEELRAMAEDEITQLSPELERVVDGLKELLQPRDPNDARDVILEIRGAEGGQEANLWAADLMRMYMRYAESRNWKVELLNTSETDLGGVKEVTFEIHGRGAYSRLKFEGGTHRVQRVPQTEAQGRIHTSTATVSVLPKADEVDVEVRDEDLRVDVYRAAGHGGQGVNTTDSAVRLTHLPTGLVVTCQDERSQLKNKARALEVLRSRLFEMELRKQQETVGALRRLQVGTGERAEKIRTYNFRENRVTDHRINLTLYNLDRVLTGQLDPLIDALTLEANKDA